MSSVSLGRGITFFSTPQNNSDLKVKKVITQKEFLEKMGIVQRAEILSKKMKFREQSDLYLRLKRLLSPNLMGSLFKVMLAYNHKAKNFLGF